MQVSAISKQSFYDKESYVDANLEKNMNLS